MNTENDWWEENLRRLFHSVWGASPWNEERITDSAIEVVKGLFREQRKRDWEEFRELTYSHDRSTVKELLLEIDSKLKDL